LEGEGGVVAQYAKSEEGGFVGDAGADLAEADDAKGAAGEEGGAFAGEKGEGGGDIFGDGVGVAAGRGGPGDVGAVQKGNIEVIGAGGGGGDEGDGGVFEEFLIDECLGADDEGIGVQQVLTANVAVGEDGDIAEAREGLACV